jgi:hypothetical protein
MDRSIRLGLAAWAALLAVAAFLALVLLQASWYYPRVAPPPPKGTEMSLEEFLDLARRTRTTYRVRCRTQLGTTYDGKFADSTQWLALDLSPPAVLSLTKAHGYALRSTPAGRKLGKLLAGGPQTLDLDLWAIDGDDPPHIFVGDVAP